MPHQIGVFPGMSNEEYHAAPGISKSGLDLFAKSPAHYYAAYLDPDRKPRVETPAMAAGTALHTAILEPEHFDSRYIIEPDNAPRRPTPAQINAAKPSENTIHAVNFWNDFNARAAGKTQITSDEYDNFMRCADAVRQHPAIRLLFGSGRAEESIFAKDPETGMLVKCRPDWQAFDFNAWIDIKSTEDARPGPFGRSSYNFGYDVASAFYPDVAEMAGLDAPEVMFFVAFEKAAPYGVIVYEPDEEFIAAGRRKYRQRLAEYAACVASNKWPGYSAEVQTLSLPAWARNE